jgi:hypothetical protein
VHRIFAGLAAWTTAAILAEFVLGIFVGGAVRDGRPADAQRLFTWHMMLGIVVGTLVTAIHVMTMFHFIGSGKEIKEHAAILGDHAEIVRKLRRFKMLTSPLATFAPLLTGAAVILGGGAHTGGVALGEQTFLSVPAWSHWVVGLAALALNLVAFPIEYRCLKLNLDLIREVDARVRREIAPRMFREAPAE